MNTHNTFKGILGFALAFMSAASASADPAVVIKGTGTLDIDAVGFNDCLGEEVRQIGSITYDYHVVQLPGGGYIYHDLWLNLESTVYGLESGHVWITKKNVSPYVEISNGGGGVTLFTARTTFVSETEPTVEIRSVFHLSFNANGELKVDRLEERCWTKE